MQNVCITFLLIYHTRHFLENKSKMNQYYMGYLKTNHVHPWLIHVTVWQSQYSIAKQNKVKILKKTSKKKKTNPFEKFVT